MTNARHEHSWTIPKSALVDESTDELDDVSVVRSPGDASLRMVFGSIVILGGLGAGGLLWMHSLVVHPAAESRSARTAAAAPSVGVASPQAETPLGRTEGLTPSETPTSTPAPALQPAIAAVSATVVTHPVPVTHVSRPGLATRSHPAAFKPTGAPSPKIRIEPEPTEASDPNPYEASSTTTTNEAPTTVPSTTRERSPAMSSDEALENRK